MPKTAVSTEDLLLIGAKHGSTAPDPSKPRSLVFPSQSDSRLFEADLARLSNGESVDTVLAKSDRPATKERSWTDAAISTGLRVVPAVAGSVLGTFAAPFVGPFGPVGGGAAGSALGEYLAEKYENPDQDASLPQVALAGALGAIPVGKYVASASESALRAVSPQAERYVAGKLASEAVPIGANVFERAKAANVLGLAAKGAAVGAPTAAIENTINRAVQGQGTGLQDIGQDLTLGALMGGVTRAVPKVAQLPFRKAAPRAGEGIPVRVRQPEYGDDARRLLDNTADRAAGRPEMASPASVAASRGYTGTIDQQLDQASAGIVEASKRIDAGLSTSNVSTIPLSDTDNLTQQLDSLSAYFGGSSKADARSAAANRLANAVRGKVRVDPKVVYDIKKFIDGARSDASFSKDPGQLSSQSALVDLSNSVRADLKDALPSIAALLDYQHGNYGILSNLAEAGAKRPFNLSTADWLATLAASLSLQTSPKTATGFAVAGVARKVIAESPRARAALGNVLNYVAGNRFDEIPQVGDLPTTTIRGELGPGANRIARDATGDTSYVRAGEGPVIQRVQPRLGTGASPRPEPQAPSRSGSAAEAGGFGGILSEGELIGENQVPFVGTAPLGGIPSRGEPRVRMPSPDVPVLQGEVVEPRPGRGDYVDATVVIPVAKQLRGSKAIPMGPIPDRSGIVNPSPPKSAATAKATAAAKVAAATADKAKKLAAAKAKTKKKGA